MSTPKAEALIHIWRHRKAHTYELQLWAKLTPSGGGWGGVDGPPVVVGEHDPEDRLIAAVLAGLETSRRSVYDSRVAPKEPAGSARMYDIVSVKRFPGGEIEVVPLERARGGHRSVDDAICRLNADEVEARLAAVIRAAFDRIA